MIKKIVLENFMAHEHTEVVLGAGVTALTGPNNTGKSAIVEALRCVATNPTPKHYIRHGARETRVSLELEDGITVVWVRKKRSAGYELHRPGQDEPEEYWKLGRGVVPGDIRDVLRLDPVELEGGERIDVHIGNQREPIFLLNLPDRAVADFLASSSEGAHLLSMQGALKRRIMEAKKEVSGREARLRAIESELDTLAPLPELTLLAEAAQGLEARIRQLQVEIPDLERLVAERSALEERMYWLRRGAEAMQALAEPPHIHDVQPLKKTLEDQARLERHLRQAGAVADALQGLAAPPQLDNVHSVGELASSLQSVADDVEQARRRAATLGALAEPPGLYDDSALKAAAHTMHELLQRRQQAQLGVLSLEQEMNDFETELKARLQDMGCCPTCGGDLDADDFLAGGCRHDA